jgi:hypothetical protein
MHTQYNYLIIVLKSSTVSQTYSNPARKGHREVTRTHLWFEACVCVMVGIWLLVLLLLVLLTPPLTAAAVLQCRTAVCNFAAAAVLACSTAGGMCVAAAAAEPIPNVALRSFNEGFEAYQQGQWVSFQIPLDLDTCSCFADKYALLWSHTYNSAVQDAHPIFHAIVAGLLVYRVLQSSASQQRSRPGSKLQHHQTKQLRSTS